MACSCISVIDNKLREHNVALVTTMFGKPERVVVATWKIDTKKRAKTPKMLASFCPFCGTRYEIEEPTP